MLEIIKLIVRIICGVLPVLWGLSLWTFSKKNKFERTCAILTFALIWVGITQCIIIATG